MRDILDVISTRKSIRRYKPEPVSEELIMKVLEAARWAPTGENDTIGAATRASRINIAAIRISFFTCFSSPPNPN